MKLILALAQVNPTVGDFSGNAGLIVEFARRSVSAGADLVVFPEMVLSGYPPEDLLKSSHFLEMSRIWLDRVAGQCRGIAAVVGCPIYDGGVRNAAVVIYDGDVVGSYYKSCLPNYGVFDEKRYFTPGSDNPVFRMGSALFGVSLCEDIWLADGPPARQARGGARLLVNLSASPFHAGKLEERVEILSRVSMETGAFVGYCNLVGGQDELVFDGQSVVIDPEGKIVGRAKAFEQDLLLIELPLTGEKATAETGETGVVNIGALLPRCKEASIKARMEPEPGVEEGMYDALVLGVRDYARKNRFEKAVVGLSGGIDSSLTVTIACDALGSGNVAGVAMPSMVSSVGSVVDAREIADNLGIKLLEIPINHVLDSYLEALDSAFRDRHVDVTEENLQARIRGNLLMALSNKFGWLVLSTGNKSETSIGYSTLYGDMAGGLSVIKDVPKTIVYRLSRYRNQVGAAQVIPESVLTKEPSAELAPGQKDTDSLPSYEILDPILNSYIVEDEGIDEITAGGIDRETVAWIARRVDGNEFKRRQGPIGIKITARAFGRDRRMPITNRFEIS